MSEFDSYKRKNGYYYCDKECHNPKYPKPKWKTEKGIKTHLEGCQSTWKQKVENHQEVYRIKEEKRVTELLKQKEALEHSPLLFNIGDSVYFKYQIVTHPKYVLGRKVRYQEICKTVIEYGTIKYIRVSLINNQYYARVYKINGRYIVENDIIDCKNNDEMVKLNIEYDKKHKEYIEMLYRCGD
jgi:hypothetical protein